MKTNEKKNEPTEEQKANLKRYNNMIKFLQKNDPKKLKKAVAIKNLSSMSFLN